MHRTQPRPTPLRTYEPNILSNPFVWMGVWTPQGWRVHRKRFGRAERLTVTLSGDGRTTFFPEALLDPRTARVEWQDDLHLKDDPFTDGGIYPADPRVEYPVYRPRWAVSHTLLCYPVADHTLYTHEYTWDMVYGHVQTHFRRHVELEEARTNATDGRTVRVRHRPISCSIEGNVHYPLPNSAVRGVWGNASKTGTNYYTRRVTQLVSMHNAVYGVAPHAPVVQCHGMWAVSADDPLDEVFDRETGDCKDAGQVIERMHIPLDEPKIGLLTPAFRQVQSRIYNGPVSILAEAEAVVPPSHLEQLRQRKGSRFVPGRVGYAADNRFDGDADGMDVRGYSPQYDLNGDGVIDDADEALLARHVGRTVRYNLYLGAYFGGDWLTTSVLLEPEHRQGIPAIADYTYGGGYDAQAGVIRLLETPGPDQPVWVEYYHDAPAEPGEDNFRLHLYREL
jgi:hypothetical protein